MRYTHLKWWWLRTVFCKLITTIALMLTIRGVSGFNVIIPKLTSTQQLFSNGVAFFSTQTLIIFLILSFSCFKFDLWWATFDQLNQLVREHVSIKTNQITVFFSSFLLSLLFHNVAGPSLCVLRLIKTHLRANSTKWRWWWWCWWATFSLIINHYYTRSLYLVSFSVIPQMV